jgi:bifunctional DNase/RNase
MKSEIHLQDSEWFVKFKTTEDFGMTSANLTFHNDGGKFKFRMMESDAIALALFILDNTKYYIDEHYTGSNANVTYYTTDNQLQS